MKKIKLTIVLILFSFIGMAQQIVPFDTFNTGDNSGKYFKDIDDNFSSFIGTWEYTEGNETFRLILSKTTKKPYGSPVEYWRDIIEGKFYLIVNAGQSTEMILCQSEKTFYQSGYTSTYVVHVGTTDGINLSGYLNDTCNSDLNATGFTCHIDMSIIDSSTTPLQANWKVYRKGLTPANFSYSFPNNIILTKQP